jgi:hypothetical protein
MTESKKVWVEPELIVLVRNKPEEAVLEGCKASVGAGTWFANNGCYEVLSCGSMACMAITQS